jgi:hypothetical protein
VAKAGDRMTLALGFRVRKNDQLFKITEFK